MVMQVVDYSAGFPGAQRLKDAGLFGAVRYIGFPGRQKCTTVAELRDFTNANIGMALVFENNTTDWRGGFTTGQASGRTARDHANAIGFPADRPIYMAVDQDVVATGEFGTMIEYLRGAGTSLGGAYLTGVYGEADVIDRARDAGVAAWFWQTVAWSRGRRTAAHLFQHVGTVTVNGVVCDLNDVLVDDWGQHLGGSMALTDDDISRLIGRLWYGDRFRDEDGAGPIPAVNFGQVMEELLQNSRKAARQTEGLSDDEANIVTALSGARGDVLTAIAALPEPGQLTDVQVADLAEKLHVHLGADVAAELGRRLSTGS